MTLPLLRRCALLFALACSPWAAAQPPAAPDLSAYRAEIDGWADEIARFEALDRSAPDPEGAVLLLGSSSIRLWETAARDLAPLPVIRRGYGGAKFTDLAHYAPRLVTPHDFRAVVVFVANDITGGAGDRPPELVGRLFGYVADVIEAHRPGTPVVCADVRPCPLRFGAWDKIQRGNAALREACDARPHCHYLDTSDAYLDADGQARSDVYGPDRLHLNEAGYALWSGQIKAKLDGLLAE